MSVFKRQNRVLQQPDKAYFELWRELGTLPKVSKHLTNAGEINQKRHKPISDVTIRTAALRYVIENPDEAKEFFDKENGRVMDQTIWEEYLVKTALSIYDTSTDKLVSWIRRKGMEKYDYIYSKRIPRRLLE